MTALKAGFKKIRPVGIVIKTGDGVAIVKNLRGVKAGEMVYFPKTAVFGIVLTIVRTKIKVIIFAANNLVRSGDRVIGTSKPLTIGVGPTLLNRVISPLGKPVDNRGAVEGSLDIRLVEIKAPGIISRESVNEPLLTGILGFDALLPFGRGQRELIIGDRQVGKTSIAVDTIISNRNNAYEDDDVELNDSLFCVYVGIAGRAIMIKKLEKDLEETSALAYSIIVMSSAGLPASVCYIAPFVGCAIGEWFRDGGLHALNVYDDLSKHAVSYRQVALVLRRSPGREAYPGDIFYLHSRLLERSAKLNSFYGGGSLSCLPIIETQSGDVSTYIPTNVVSITDGQVFLDTNLFRKGVRPSINYGVSVSRVGSMASLPIIKKLAGTLKLDLAYFREVEVFSTFKSELDELTRSILDKGIRLTYLLNQMNGIVYTEEMEAVMLVLPSLSIFNNFDEDDIENLKFYLQNSVDEYMDFFDLDSATFDKDDIEEYVEFICNDDSIDDNE